MQAQGGEARPGKSGRADAQDSPSRVPPCLPHPSPLRPHRPDRSDIVDTRQPYQRKQQASPGKAGPVGRLPCATATIWDDLMESGFASVRHFTSLHTLEETGEAVRRRMMSSELDLNLFQRHTVEDQVSLIIQGMHSDRRPRQKFGLQGSVNFENHANTLSPEEQLEEDMEQLMVSGTGRRQSPRLQAKAKAKAKETRPSGSTGTAEAEDAGRKSTASSSRPRADQFAYTTRARLEALRTALRPLSSSTRRCTSSRSATSTRD
ncbi:metalloprotease [Alternaria alternata]|nr:metalloprotease [Alternaria alternata]